MLLTELRFPGGLGTHVSGDPRSEARKPSDRMTALGQIFTPEDLADRMICQLDLASLGASSKILDPCVGPDTFPAALRRSSVPDWAIDAVDVDERMCALTSAARDLRVHVENTDYLSRPLKCYDAAVLNPPYVRQEWIRNKDSLRQLMRSRIDVSLPGTANLYVYFIVKVIAELRAGGRMACLVYDSWQSTLYGRWLRNYLDRHCEWTSEAVAGCPFEGRLIDATIIYATKRAHPVLERERPIGQNAMPGRAPIDDLFTTRRGLRLKQSNFFMTAARFQDREASTPFVKKVNRVSGLAVAPDHEEAALLVSKGVQAPQTMRVLEQRLAEARLSPRDNVAILTWADERPDAWHLHAPAPKAPILFNYFMRHRPKHLANPHSIGFSDNFYGLTPREQGSNAAWFAALNSTASAAGILRAARNQGAGLAKTQLFEYRLAGVVDIRAWMPVELRRLERLGLKLANDPGATCQTINEIDQLIAEVTGEPTLSVKYATEEFVFADHQAKRPGDVN